MKASKACGLYLVFIIALWAPFAHASWTPPVRISDEGYSLAPRLVANGYRLHVVYCRAEAFTSSYYLRSTDGGESWGQPFHLADTNYTSNNVMPVVRSEGGSVAVIWRGSLRGGGTGWNYGFRLSTDGGDIWNDIGYILPTDSFILQKHIFVISDSRLYLLYSRIAQQELVVEFAKSADWGETWTEPAEIFRTQETGRFEMVARGDTIHFVWVGRFNYDDKWETYYIKSENSGEMWTDNIALSTVDDKGSLWPSISVNDEGNLVACWMDFKYSPYFLTGDIFVRYSHDAGNSWTEEDQLTFHHRVHATRILWQGDSLHVAWEDWRNDQTDIYYMLSTDNGLSWRTEERVEEDPGQSLNPSLAVMDETVHVVWRQDSGLDGRGLYYSRRDEVSEIPTLSEWGMLILALLLLASGTAAVVRRGITSKRQDVISFPS